MAHKDSTDNPHYNACGIVIMSCWDKPGTTFSDHIIIANNVVYDCSGSGIGASWVADYITVRSNIVAHNAFWCPYAGSGISFFDFHDSKPTDTGIRNQISENVCFGNDNLVPCISDTETPKRITDGNGIIVDCFNLSSPPYTGKTVIENNICFDNGAIGININRSDHLIIRNNTLYYNLKSRDFPAGDLCFWNNHDNGEPIVSDITATNNAVFSRNSIKDTVHACFIGTADDVSGFTFADNLFYGVGSSVGWG